MSVRQGLFGGKHFFMRRLIMFGVVFAIAVMIGRAETYYVAETGLDDRTGTGDWTNALATISNALAKAVSPNDLVLVSNGVFTLNAELTIDNQITVRSLNGPQYTMIDGNYPIRNHRSVKITNPQAVLSGFTISNSAAFTPGAYDGGGVWMDGGVLSNCFILNSQAQNYGGGVYVDADGGTVVGCTIKNCSAGIRGGGVVFDSTSGTLTHSEIVSNESSTGGGIYVSSASSGITISNCLVAGNDSTTTGTSSGGGGLYLVGVATIANCKILDNTAQTGGGGAYSVSDDVLWENCLIQGNRTELTTGKGGGGLYLGTTQRLTGSLIVSNHAATTAIGWGGGGVYIYRNNTEVYNCTIVSNSANRCGGIYINRSSSTGSTNHFVNMLVYFNSADSYPNYFCQAEDVGEISFSNCCLTPAPRSGYHTDTITSDPLLVDVDGGDYRLSAASPCVNAGLTLGDMFNESDMDRHRRVDPFSGIVDIGAYEYFPPGLLIITR